MLTEQATEPTVEVREKPIALRRWEVQAIIEGRKTQLRRLVVPQPGCLEHEGVYGDLYNGGPEWAFWLPDHRMTEPRTWTCPFGSVGDRLWVRETWQAIHVYVDWETGLGDDVSYAEKVPENNRSGYWGVAYAATDSSADDHRDDRGFPWRPPLHMPRWASRLTLNVTDVGLHRLQDMTDDDGKAEGVEKFFDRFECIGRDQRITDGRYARDEEYRSSYACTWDEMFGDKALWIANAWVWSVTFKGEVHERRKSGLRGL